MATVAPVVPVAGKVIEDTLWKPHDFFKAYEDGKGRRYNLLFAVNGGAFAIAKLFTGEQAAKSVGDLTIPWLAVGMVLFTLVMGYDIFKFGERMHEMSGGAYFKDAGRRVLKLICGLLCAGWIFASGVFSMAFALFAR